MTVPFRDPISSVIETSARGGKSLAVTLQDQTTGVLDLTFLTPIATPTLGADTVVDTRTVTLSPGHGLTPANAGQILELASTLNGSHFIQARIQTVVGDVVTVDSPLNRVYLPASTDVSVGSEDMNVDGSVTPAVFSVTPTAVQSGDMTRIICEIRDTTAMDFETFGGLPELTNGLVLRVNNGDGTYRHLFNAKSNGDIIELAYDHSFATNNGGGTRGFTTRVTWAGQNKHGAAIRLDGSLGESLEFVVQDDLTGLTRMHWTAQGSELQGD